MPIYQRVVFTFLFYLIKKITIKYYFKLNILEVVIKRDLDYELQASLKGNYGIEMSFDDELLENAYESVYENVEEPHYIEAIKHLMHYLVVKELKDLSHFKPVEVVIPDDYLMMMFTRFVT